MGPSLRKGSCGIRRMGMAVMHGAFRNGSAYAGRPGPVQLQMLHASRLLFPTEASRLFLGAGMEKTALQQFPQRINATPDIRGSGDDAHIHQSQPPQILHIRNAVRIPPSSIMRQKMECYRHTMSILPVLHFFNVMGQGLLAGGIMVQTV